MDLLIMEARPVRDVMRRLGWRVLAAVHRQPDITVYDSGTLVYGTPP